MLLDLKKERRLKISKNFKFAYFAPFSNKYSWRKAINHFQIINFEFPFKSFSQTHQKWDVIRFVRWLVNKYKDIIIY